MNVQLTGTIFALRKILHAIETNQPALFVDNLQVRSQVPGELQARIRATSRTCTCSST